MSAMTQAAELKQLGGHLRRRRQEIGATQLEVAQRLGVTRQWLVRVEAGTGNPDLRQVLRLCEVLDLSLTVSPVVALRTPSASGPRKAPVPPKAAAVGKKPALRTGAKPGNVSRSEAVSAAARDKARPRAAGRRSRDVPQTSPGLFVDLDDMLGTYKRQGRQ